MNIDFRITVFTTILNKLIFGEAVRAKEKELVGHGFSQPVDKKIGFPVAENPILIEKSDNFAKSVV
ncbi:MAG: hypothetical protein R3C26_16255 [Calditrichia bacterium]